MSSSSSSSVQLPRVAEDLVSAFSIAFTPRTFQRVIVLFVGSVLALGRHTVTGALRVTRSLTEGGGAGRGGGGGGGHFSDYHRVFSRARWSMWPLGKVLAALVLELVPPDEPVVCPVDDTTPQHKGKHVYGKGKHRDNCRSTRSHTVWVFGHKWVVLCVNVKFAFATRPWSLPVLAALYRTKELNQRENRRHKTPIEIARQLIAVLMHWFPRRKFILLGDGGYASHELARFAHRHRRRLTLVSLCHPRANLYGLPPTRKPHATGRPRVKGAKLPAPREAVARARRRAHATVGWYGGKHRHVELVSGCGHWYKAARGLVPIRWVFVHDADGTHEDRYFFSTDPAMTPQQIVTLYTGRWSIEVTFQEARQHLGLATPRSRTRNSVLRIAPCLLGLFSLVSLIYHRHTRGRGSEPAQTPWYTKHEVTFADAIASVRRLLWQRTVFQGSVQHGALEKLPTQLREMLLDQLSRAA
jgi:hypothetical protein